MEDMDTCEFQYEERNCVHVNVSNVQIWCQSCKLESYSNQDESVYNGKDITTVQNSNCHISSQQQLLPSPLPPSPPPRGVVGLPNLGNTCYMNSALQALMNSPPIIQFFTREDLNCLNLPKNERGSSLLLAFQKLICFTRVNRTPPSSVLFLIRATHRMFMGFQQHDSQEFLRCFMEALHEELKAAYDHIHTRCKLSQRKCDVSCYDSDPDYLQISSDDEDYETCDSDAEATVCWPLTQLPEEPNSKSVSLSGVTVCVESEHKTIISEVFDGVLLSSVECLTCKRVSSRVEPFQDLSLAIPSRDHLNLLHQTNDRCSYLYNREESWLSWFYDWLSSWFWGPSVSLHDCLSAFFSADELKGDNMYSCKKCKKLRNGVKFSKMLKIPEVLCIHLKRFRQDHLFSSKITNHIKFPLEGLDLKLYIHEDCKNKITTYNLNSVICHHGASGSGGHYTCYALNSGTNQWYHYDDMVVTKVSKETVAACQAYVLFYRRELEVTKPKARCRRDEVKCHENGTIPSLSPLES